MNIIKTYTQLVEGKITKDQFVQQVRINPSIKHLVNSFMSCDDIIKVLVRKNIITEQTIKEKEVVKSLLKEDLLPGGLADNKTVEDLAAKHGVSSEEIQAALDKGCEVEKEHTNDVNQAKEIAMDHLSEDPKYYEKLSTIEKEGCKDCPPQGSEVFTADVDELKDINPEDAEAYMEPMTGEFDEPQLGKITPEGTVRLARDIRIYKPSILPQYTELIRYYMAHPDAEEDVKHAVLALCQHADLDIAPNWSIAMQPELNEGKKKQEKIEIENNEDFIPNSISPDELRRGLKAEFEKTKDFKKATKAAIKNLTKDPLYYLRKEKGLLKDKKKRTDLPKEATKTNLVDKDNKMIKAKLNEVHIHTEPGSDQPNELVRQAKTYIDSNPTLKQESEAITLYNEGSDKCMLKYFNWEILPNECVQKLSLQFDVSREGMEDSGDENSNDNILQDYYILSKKTGDNSPKKDLGNSFDKFKQKIGSLVKEVIDDLHGIKEKPNPDVQEKVNRINDYAKAAKRGDYEALASMSYAEREYCQNMNSEYYDKIRQKYGIDEEVFRKSFEEYEKENSNKLDPDELDPAGGTGLDSHIEESKKNLEESEVKAVDIKPGASFKMAGSLGKFKRGTQVTIIRVEREEDDIRIDLKNEDGEEDSFYMDPNDSLNLDDNG